MNAPVQTDLTCIYCLTRKASSEFNVEHVIPRSFGTFKNNFTLKNTVCKECNTLFAQSLEIHLARDTIEGRMRFDHGIKKHKQFTHFGLERVRIKIADGPFAGQIVYLTFSEHSAKPVIMPIPQIGLKKRDNSGYEWFTFDRIPHREEVDEEIFDMHDPKSICGSAELSAEDVKVALDNLGYNFTYRGEHMFNPQENAIACDVEFRIDKTIKRAIAKVAFNYFCYVAGREVSLMRPFDMIRGFVRNKTDEPYPLLQISDIGILEDEQAADSRRRLGHVITVNWAADNKSIVCQVSILNYWSYAVCIARDVRSVVELSPSGHFFNLASREILELGCRRKILEP